MAIKRGEYYEHPVEIWDEKKCQKIVNYTARDGCGTKYPFKGYIGSWQWLGGGYGKTRYNGGCVRDGDWYEGEIRPLPIVAEGFKIVKLIAWGYRIVKEKTDEHNDAG